MITFRNITEAGITSALIRFWSRSAYSHSEVWCPPHAVGNKEAGWLGARFSGGVQVRPPDYCVPTASDIVHVSLDVQEELLFWDFLKSQLGKPYDWLAIVSFVVRFRMRLKNHWFCSELMNSAMEATKHYPSIASDLLTPGDFDNYLHLYNAR